MLWWRQAHNQHTGSSDVDLQLPRPSPAGVYFEVGCLAHPHPPRLQAAPTGSTRLGFGDWQKKDSQ